MQLQQLNTCPSAEADAAFRSCADVDRWVDRLVQDRPYADRDVLLTHAAQLATTWTERDLDAALADHPRIGERHAGDGASADASAREQAGVGDDADVRVRLAEGNARYEERFGRIYLVRAAGRDAEEMLALLEQRLQHDDATEVAVAVGQLAQIALLRLAALLDDGDGAGGTGEARSTDDRAEVRA
ncbi:2-oxo-4-hydroxy-4-carboxy-5-ureidoimidazoline decarboxylase [Nocardioidaceae bacterium]|nr:2-oxo-4-hydroxy-4-carboxy-5-ureidoimidazoline decarboxylase [Nocardioidaceae bacterium]